MTFQTSDLKDKFNGTKMVSKKERKKERKKGEKSQERTKPIKISGEIKSDL